MVCSHTYTQQRAQNIDLAQPVDLFLAYLTMSFAWVTLTNAAIINILGLWFVERRGLCVPLAVCMGLELAAAAMVLVRIGPARTVADARRKTTKA